MPATNSRPTTFWGSIKQAFRTFFTNAFGSDTLTAYTAEYAWLSNQMAHAMMGFFLAALWAFAYDRRPQWLHWACVWLPLAVPILKEITDYVLDALVRKTGFVLDKRELLKDALTDVFFWSFGMLLAIAVFGFDGVNWQLLIGTAVVGVPIMWGLVFKLWVPRMRMFDGSRMPFNYVRLAKYTEADKLLETEEIKKIVAYQEFVHQHALASQQKDQHVIVTGGKPFDRSRLAVSLGCEFIGRWKGVYMIPGVKLLEDPTRLTTVCAAAEFVKANIHCLIIDDLNVSLPVPRGTRTERHQQRADNQESLQQMAAGPEAQLKLEAAAAVTEKLLHFTEVFNQLRARHPQVTSIWVMSATKNEKDQKRLAMWKAAISKLLVDEQHPSPELVEIMLKDDAPSGLNEGK